MTAAPMSQVARAKLRKFAEQAAKRCLRMRRVREVAFAALHLVTDTASIGDESSLFYVFPTTDWIIGRSLYTQGEWESAFVRSAVEHVVEMTGRPIAGRTVVDVGANIGTTALPMLKIFGARQVIALEPNPICLRYLRANAAANDLEQSCLIVPVAVSDGEGKVELEVNPDNSGGSYVVETSSATTVSVPARTLSAILKDVRVALSDVALVWVDAEGHEFRVLAGAEEALDARVPFLVEFWPEQLRRNGDFDALVDLVVSRIARVVDIRAAVQGSRPAHVLPTKKGLHDLAAALGPWPTDLLLLS